MVIDGGIASSDLLALASPLGH